MTICQLVGGWLRFGFVRHFNVYLMCIITEIDEDSSWLFGGGSDELGAVVVYVGWLRPSLESCGVGLRIYGGDRFNGGQWVVFKKLRPII